MRDLMAKFANASYRYKNNPEEIIKNGIYDFDVLPEFSDMDSSVFITPEDSEDKFLIVSVKGTSLNSIEDINLDFELYNTGQISKNKRTEHIINKVKKLLEYNIDIYLTGHSLGASIISDIASELIDYPQIKGFYLFNIGYPPRKLYLDLQKRIICKFIKSRQCKKEKLIKQKMHIYTSADPISILSLADGSHFQKPNMLNVHSINNFLKD